MKTLIALLFTAVCYSQASIYIPANTTHYKDSKAYAEGQGGNKGFVLSFSDNKRVLSVGVISNSYGDISRVIALGITRKINNLEIIGSVGFADGYEKAYQRIIVNNGKSYLNTTPMKMPKILSNNGIMPVGLLSLKLPVKGCYGIQMNISPAYINTGIYLNL